MMITDDPTPPLPAARIALKVVPGSRAAAVVGPLGERLKVKVAAPPEDGKANRAVCELLAKALGIGERSVTIVSGHSRAEKVARIEGLSGAEVRTALRF